MIILTCLIVCAVAALILNGAYSAQRTVSKNMLQPITKPEEVKARLH